MPQTARTAGTTKVAETAGVAGTAGTAGTVGTVGTMGAELDAMMTKRPRLTGGARASAPSEETVPTREMDTTNANLDPQLGQARDEAVGVAKQLERS